MADTKYKILEERKLTILGPTQTATDEQATSVQAWVEVGEITTGNGQRAAVREFVSAGHLEPGGVTVEKRRFVAIPMRSWHPRPAGVEVQERLVVG